MYETGVVADRSVNADNAKEVGDKIIKSIKSRTILDFSFKRKDQIVTMASKTSLKIDRETVASLSKMHNCNKRLV